MKLGLSESFLCSQLLQYIKLQNLNFVENSSTVIETETESS
jgi:hypothetical protein